MFTNEILETKIEDVHVADTFTFEGVQCNGQEVSKVQDSTRIQITHIAVVKKWMQQKYASRINRQDFCSLLLLVHEHVRVVF